MVVSDHKIGCIIQFRQRAPGAKPEPAITIATYLYFIEQLSVAINYGVRRLICLETCHFLLPLLIYRRIHDHLIAFIIKDKVKFMKVLGLSLNFSEI